MASEQDVREIALSLPETIEKLSYGTPGFRVRDRLFARLRDENEVLVLWRESLEEKEFLLAAESGKLFTTPHYDGYPMILVRLDAIDREELAELIEESWRLRAP
ncbi:MAG TPA: MmcQ/YjbR family DNA-binding protein [Solirubrobacterales bacterium]